jgi:hypothetical protein
VCLPIAFTILSMICRAWLGAGAAVHAVLKNKIATIKEAMSALNFVIYWLVYF